MANDSIGLYLNDHLAGATVGTQLAAQIRDRSEGTDLGEIMIRLTEEVQRDRELLVELMERLGVSRSPVKQATGWIAEKASRVKLSGASAGDSEYGIFMALETLRLGVEGKRCLWLVLREMRDDRPELRAVDLDDLIERAASQERVLEEQRMLAGARAF